MEREEESEPKHDGIEIDMKQLARVMGDMMPDKVMLTKRTNTSHINRKGLSAQEAALIMLANENRWQSAECNSYYLYKTFVRIR